MHPEQAQRRVRLRERWEAATKWPLIGLSIAFVVAYSLVVLLESPREELFAGLLAVLAVCWAAFIADIFFRAVALTPRGSRSAYLRHNLVDLASTVIPPVRPFQLLKYLRFAPGFRGQEGNAFRSRLIVTAALYVITFVYVIALMALQVERDAPNASIVTFGESIWWAVVTIATVGYGDVAPVTAGGRILAVVLMVGGVAIIGTASALIVSYLTERIANAKREHLGSSSDEDA